jgi:tRNA dimethylallyltransferase
MSTAQRPQRVLRHTVGVTIVLVGPTAAGKSSLAAALVRRYAAEGRSAEVVNADSMLVYRGMDIGTAKPSEQERSEIRHHMVDLFDVDQSATVAEFQQLARSAIADCRARNVIPIVVGGSALYVRAIVDDFEFPGTDPAIRARLENEVLVQGAERLHERLSDVDPVAATRILPRNTRRVVRALEVIELTGRSFSAVLPERRYVLGDVVQIGLAVDRPTLDARIAARVAAMWTQGFVDEVRRLAAAGLRQSLTASRALGYRQVLRYLDGEISEEQARELTIVGTRKFARRQDSWFRKDRRIAWLAFDHSDLVSAAYLLAGPAGAGALPDGRPA